MKLEIMGFIDEVLEELASCIVNDFDDNWDSLRYGKAEPIKRKGVRANIQRILNRRGYFHIQTIRNLISSSCWVSKFEYLYNNLEYEDDKKLLLKVIAYRILGYRKVKMPLNNKEYKAQIEILEKLENKSDCLQTNFMHFKLYRMNLHKIKFPIEIYFNAGGVAADFIVKQYEYKRNGIEIKAEKRDIVLDGGGCWGDTALYFANEVGAEGKVYSFEFIPNNLAIFEKNLSLNIVLRDRIVLIKKPLWNDSGTKVFFENNGPGSKISFERFDELSLFSETVSIDDLIRDSNVEMIDFIKMDIEGAEINGLKGASETIKKFKPKLAIALYHSVEDFELIPTLLKEIVPEYKFYFSHCSLNAEESILFAKV
jgi:FkbM family methyltransferase